MKVARTVWTYTKSERIVRDGEGGVPVVLNKAALNAALLAADSKVEADYTAASWTAFGVALANAKAMPETTQGEVNSKTSAVNAAVVLLVAVDPDPIFTFQVLNAVTPGKKNVIVQFTSGEDETLYDVFVGVTALTYKPVENWFYGVINETEAVIGNVVIVKK